MFSHIMVGSNDIARSKKFYDALFVAMGAQPGVEDARGRLSYTHNGGRFMVSKPIDGKPACHANGGTIGFTMSDAKQAEAWHKAGVANGGTSIEDPPGVRQGASMLVPPFASPALCHASACLESLIVKPIVPPLEWLAGLPSIGLDTMKRPPLCV